MTASRRTLLALLVPFTVASIHAQPVTPEQQRREAAIVETALAYWRKGAVMQYDSSPMTVFDKNNHSREAALRMSRNEPPETATKDRTVYTVCTSFAMEVFRQAIGWDQGDWPECITSFVVTNVPEAVVFRQDNEQHPERREAAVKELRQILRPGDEIVAFAPERWGHAMLYVGDVDGDGRADVIHSTGRKFNYGTGCDRVEIGGNIFKEDAEDFFFSRASILCLEGMRRYTVIRPTLLPADRYPVTPSAAARLARPGLRIDRTVSTGRYGSVPTGGSLSYLLEIQNCSTNDYRDVPVVEKVPCGTEFVSASAGGVAEGDTVRWSVDLPGGATVKCRMLVRVVATRGETIVSKGGNVGGIPSNVLTTRVQGPALRYEDVLRLRTGGDWREKIEKSGVTGTAFVKAVYRDVFGREVQPPEPKDAGTALANGEMPEGCVPGWFGGRLVRTKYETPRVRECRSIDLMPGDVIFCGALPANAETAEAFIWTGVEVLVPRGGRIVEPGDADVEALLSKDWFYVWRPTL